MRSVAFVVVLASLFVAFHAAAEEPSAPPAPTQPAAPQSAGPAATVYLKDGSVLRGSLISQTSETLTLRTSSGDLLLAQSGIARVDFAGPGDLSAPAAPPTAPPSVWDAPPASAGTPPRAPAGPQVLPPFYIDVDFYTGLKSLDNSKWKPVGQHFEFGQQATLGMTQIPVKFAFDYFSSSGFGQQRDGAGNLVDVSGGTTEYAFGARFISDTYVFRGFAGAGVCLARASLSATNGGSSFSGSGSGVGVWANGGGFFRLGRHFNLGAMIRISTAPVKIAGTSLDAGGTEGGIFFGWGFGGATRLTRL
jgi:hypothetical protein